MPSFDSMLRPIFEKIEPEQEELEAARDRVGQLEPTLPVKNWSAYTTHRDPVLSMYAEFAVKNPDDPDDHVRGHVTIDPRSGKPLPDDQLKIGSEFFYPMHYSLHFHWLDLGYWIVGLAALSMLIALVSGVVIHKKIFREFFTFRPEKNKQRSVLDLHNLTGVVALPFHFMFAFTGLVIFAGIYFPLTETVFERLHDQHEQIEAQTKGLAHAPAGARAELASVDAMVAEAKRRWAARGMPGEVGYLEVAHVGDANSYVTIYRAGSDRVALVGQAVYFAGVHREGRLRRAAAERGRQHQRVSHGASPPALRALAPPLALRDGRAHWLRSASRPASSSSSASASAGTRLRASVARVGSTRSL